MYRPSSEQIVSKVTSTHSHYNNMWFANSNIFWNTNASDRSARLSHPDSGRQYTRIRVQFIYIYIYIVYRYTANKTPRRIERASGTLGVIVCVRVVCVAQLSRQLPGERIKGTLEIIPITRGRTQKRFLVSNAIICIRIIYRYVCALYTIRARVHCTGFSQ
jgi:hypothetical protein